jgi:hypothetical protein
VIGKPLQIAAPQTTGIEVKKPGLVTGFPDPNLELCEKTRRPVGLKFRNTSQESHPGRLGRAGEI